ncbi:MAG: hypothetical protein WC816_10570 [Sphingomonas sp.]|jgi:hypothetical protein
MPVSPNVRARGKRGKHKAASAATKPAAAARTSPEPSRTNLYDEVTARIISELEAGRVPWVPRWMAFPPAAYTARGGVGTVAAHAKAQAAREIERLRPSDDEPDPTAPGAVMALPDPDDEADRLAA